MPSIFDSLSASERKAFAAKVIELPYEEQRQLVEELGSLVEKVNAAESEAGRKKQAMSNIAACKAGSLGEREMIRVLEGNLTRAGISLVSIVAAPEKIDAIFASASRPLSNETRMAIKSQLFRLGVIGK
jgi:hypothetical protein